MTITTLSSREFNQNISDAKRAASKGPVFITVRGHPAHVLLSIEEYQKLAGGQQKIAELLAFPGTEKVEFETPKIRDIVRPAKFK